MFKNVCQVLNCLLNIIRSRENDLKRELLSHSVSQFYSTMCPCALWIHLSEPSVDSILHSGKLWARLCTRLETRNAGAPSETARESCG